MPHELKLSKKQFNALVRDVHKDMMKGSGLTDGTYAVGAQFHFDSFGRTASHIWQPRLLNVRFTQSDAEQPTHHKDGRMTQWCGAACLAFAKVAQTHGLKIAAHV